MNKNTQRRLRAYRAEKKKQGTFPASIYKKKSRPFPTPNKDEALSMRDQSLLFHGKCSPHYSRD